MVIYHKCKVRFFLWKRKQTKSTAPSGKSEPSFLSVVAAVWAQSPIQISYKHCAIVWKIIITTMSWIRSLLMRLLTKLSTCSTSGGLFSLICFSKSLYMIACSHTTPKSAAWDIPAKLFFSTHILISKYDLKIIGICICISHKKTCFFLPYSNQGGVHWT